MFVTFKGKKSHKSCINSIKKEVYNENGTRPLENKAPGRDVDVLDPHVFTIKGKHYVLSTLVSADYRNYHSPTCTSW